VIVPVEGPKGCYLTALHRQSGEVVWRKALRASIESYAPATVRHVAGRDQLLLIGGTSTRGYDPENGALLWECEGPARTCVATPVADSDTVYATGGYPGRQFLAIRADGAGDVKNSHLRWTGDAKAGYVPTPVLHEGLLYAVADQGLLRCYEAKDGRVLWERDLKTPFYSSPTVAGDALYLFDRKGKGFVVPLGRSAGAVVTNELPSGVFATPVFLDSRIYLRTLGDFYCIGEK
jgi:outer membrane protein assembly factor BamB